jgi:TatA/E family protein of Tat protein translocase
MREAVCALALCVRCGPGGARCGTFAQYFEAKFALCQQFVKWPGHALPSSLRGSMMICMGFSETIFLFFLALVIFGPKKLPEIARQVGKVLNEFRRASNEFKAQIESEISQLERENHPQILPPSAPPKGAVASAPLPLTLEPAASPNPCLEAGFDPGSQQPASEDHVMAKAPHA